VYVFLYEDGKVKGIIMKTFVEVDFSVNDALCSIDIIPAIYKRDNHIKIVIGNDNTFTIDEKASIDYNRQCLNPKGFAELLEICEKLNALKRSLPIESFIIKALSNEYTEKLVKAISVLADTHYIHIVGLDSVMRCDYVGVDVVRNNDKTLNIFIDVVKYTDDERNNMLSFDIRNGKMCRFFNYDDVKVPVEIYHALNAIAGVESSFSDEQIISEIGEALKKVAGAYDVSVRKDPNNPNAMLPFPFVLPNTNM
jgi:hypothetical protein